MTMVSSTTRPLPTRKDEAWRYSAVEALQSLPEWQDVPVAAGEALRQSLTIADDAQVADPRRLRFHVGEGARCELFAVIAGGALGRIEIEVRLAAGAHFELGGVTVGGGESVREFVTRVVHEHPGATSHQVVRSVHWGRATGNFLGNIDVVRDAQKTDAAQDFKGLLLERGASVNAVPQLEIFADDVKCAHGASVGQLDEAARFYMAARGLPPEAARALLVRAFIGDALAALDDAEEQERLMALALDTLEKRL